MNEQIPVVTVDDLLDDENIGLSHNEQTKKTRKDVNYFTNLI
jgi:hypothetical protein